MLTIITPTRNRPAACALLKTWLDRQTYDGPWRWLVVDDGDVPCGIESGFETEVIRRKNTDPTIHSLPLNILHASDVLASESGPFLFMEDDEWYGVGYVRQMVEWMDGCDVVGESPTYDYNVKYRQWKVLPYQGRSASLARTGFTRRAMPFWLEAARAAVNKKTPYVDRLGWERCVTHVLPFFIHHTVQQRPMAVAIKGMPGPVGASHGHQQSRFRVNDPSMAVLRRWIGQDADYYAHFQEIAPGEQLARQLLRDA
jgi:hypothetical protein